MTEGKFGRFGRRSGDGGQDGRKHLPGADSDRRQIGKGSQENSIARREDGPVSVPPDRRARYAEAAERAIGKEVAVDFFMDATGSMAPLIENAKRSIAAIVTHLLREEQVAIQMRLGVYRDYPINDHIFAVSKRTNDPTILLNWLQPIVAHGGQHLIPGDPEAVEYALAQTEGDLVIVAGDSPSHQKFRILELVERGITHDPRTAFEIAQEHGAAGKPIYALVVPQKEGPDPLTVADFRAISEASGGASGILDGGEALLQMIVMTVLQNAKGGHAVRTFADRRQLTAGSQAFAQRLMIGSGR